MKKLSPYPYFAFVATALALGLCLAFNLGTEETGRTACTTGADADSCAFPPPREMTQQAAAEEPFTILSAEPSGGDTSTTSRIKVIFNRALVGSRQVGRVLKDTPLKIAPDISGNYIWAGRAVLLFVPEKPLPLATEFRAVVPAGTTSIDGAELGRDYAWHFSTASPEVERSTELLGDSRFDDRRGSVVVEFDQPVPLEEVRRHARLLTRDGEVGPPFIVRRLKKKERKHYRSDKKTVLLQTVEELAHDSKWKWVIGKGLRGNEGPLTMIEDWSRHIHVCPEPALKSVQGRSHLRQACRVEVKFATPVSQDEFKKHAMFCPKVVITSIYSDCCDNEVALTGSFLPGRKYTLVLDSRLCDRFGNRLGQTRTIEFTMPELKPEILLRRSCGYIERKGPRRLPVTFVNIDNAAARVVRIPEKMLDKLLRSASKWGKLFPYECLADSGTVKPVKLKGEHNKPCTVPVEIGLDATGNEGGVFLLTVSGTSSRKNIVKRALIKVTDIALTAKVSKSNLLFWATSISTARPLAGAAIKLVGTKGNVLWRGKTRCDGTAKAPGTESFKEQPCYVVARSSDDWSYAFLNENPVELWRLNLNCDFDPVSQRVSGQIFTDRQLYRPGDTVHIKGILRSISSLEIRNSKFKIQKRCGLAREREMQVRVISSWDEELCHRSLALSDYGTFSLDVTLPANAHLGWYSVEVALKGAKEKTLGHFQVEEYRAAEFEVEITPGEKHYFFGERIDGEISGRYLFGEPMKGAGVDWYTEWENTHFAPRGHESYTFGMDEEIGPGRAPASDTNVSKESTLNGKGSTSFDVPVEPRGKTPSALKCILSASVTGSNWRTVYASKQILAHPCEYYLGIKPECRVYGAGKPAGFSIACVHPDGTPARKVAVDVCAKHLRWHTVKKKMAGGAYHFVSEAVEQTVATGKMDSTKQPLVWAFTPEKPGDYEIEVSATDSKGRTALTTKQFCVCGKGRSSWPRRDDHVLELVPDKQKYLPGETARILVKSPYKSARAMLTVEARGVLRHRVMKLEGNSPQLQIPVLPGYQPNVFVSVLLLRPRVSETLTSDGVDIGRPAWSIGYVELLVDTQRRHLNVAVTPSANTAAPGEEMTVDFEVTDSAGRGRQVELAVAIVDDGVLSLVGYEMPDPYYGFLTSRALSVRTSVAIEGVIGRSLRHELGNKGSWPGDGGSADEGTIAYRSRFTPCAYWNPSLLTSPDGRASVCFKLPENLTRFRVCAVAVTKGDCFGRGTSLITVRKQLLIRPALPRFALVGDEFEGRAVVTNCTASPAEVCASFECLGSAEPAGETRCSLRLGPAESKVVSFPVRITRCGEAVFRFKATTKDVSDAVSMTIPVGFPSPRESFTQTGTVVGELLKEIAIPAGMRRDAGELEVSVSPASLAQLKEALKYVLDYPYGCIEQTTSRTLPLVAMEGLHKATGGLGEGMDPSEFAQKGVERILSMQTSQGGLGYWPDSSEPHEWGSVYGTHALVLAKRAGLDVPEKKLEAALRYLSSYLRNCGESTDSRAQAVRTYACYVLALAGKPESSYHELLYERRASLAPFACALLAAAIARSQGDKEMSTRLYEQSLEAKAGATGKYASIMDSGSRTLAIVLLAGLELGRGVEELRRIAGELLGRKRGGRWYNTQENAFALLALSRFVQKHEAGQFAAGAAIRLNGKLLGKAEFSGLFDKPQAFTVPLSELSEGQSVLSISTPQKDRKLHYSLTMRAYSAKREFAPCSAGLLVTRTIRSLDERSTPGRSPFGNSKFEIRNSKEGALAVVTLELTLPRRCNYLVVDDPVPAGFEIVNTDFRTVDPRLKELLGNEGPVDYAWRPSFEHTEKHDDRMLLFAESMDAGVYKYTYLVRAGTPGRFAHPPCCAFEMYNPDYNGRSGSVVVEVSE